jgi:hypothetical protein
MSRTLAIHWAQTTHGTWLHGDGRGSWRNGRLIGPDPYLEAQRRASLANDAVLLNAAERQVVADTFGNIVREHRHRVFATTIQATHFQLVFAPLTEPVKTVIARFKYRSAAAVLRHRHELQPASCPAETAGLYSRAVSTRRVPKSLWTSGRFPVFIFNDPHLANAIEYIRDHKRRAGLPPDPFDWIDPLFPAGDLAGERQRTSTVHESLPW